MIRDIQINPFSNEIIETSLLEYNIIVTIPNVPNYPNLNPNMFIIFLDEIPYLNDRLNYPIEIKKSDNSVIFVEVTGTPNSNEFRIAPFGSGRPNAIQFSNINAGQEIRIKYYGWGSVVSLNSFVSRNGDNMIGNYNIDGNLSLTKNIQSRNFAPTREIFNLKLVNTSGAENTKITFEKGWCFDDTIIDDPYGCVILRNLTNKIKRLNEQFAEGNDAGMLQGDPASKYLANESYLIYIIGKDNGDIDFLAVLRTDTTSLPTGYTKKRRIGIIMTDSSKNIVQFTHIPEEKTYYWKDKKVFNSWQVPTTETAVYVDVPKGISVVPLINVSIGTAESYTNMSISIRGIERNYFNFSQYANIHSLYNSELGSRFETGGNVFYGEALKYIKFYTTINGELYFQRKGNYASGSSYYSTRQIYGFIDYTV